MFPKEIPVIYCFGILFSISISNMVHNIPSRIPIWEPSPSDSNIRKKITAQNGAPGNSTMACVKTIKANPVPSAAWKWTNIQLPYIVYLFLLTASNCWAMLQGSTLKDVLFHISVEVAFLKC